MFYLIAQLAIMLLLIFVASQLFTNALEYWGHQAGWSTGVTGSIFAAVATALPETSVPFIALLAGTSNQMVNEDIGVGAILGAPLMISTLSTSMMALFALKRRGLKAWIHPEPTGFIRDLNFFISAFLAAALAMFLPPENILLRGLISVLLVGLYLVYLKLTIRVSKKLVADGHGVIPDEALLLSRLGFKNNRIIIVIQLFLGLLLLLGGAKGFIEGVEEFSKALQVSVLLIALIIIPIATELPEKINSILWVRKNKDTLAFGNLTGAMVFQGTLLPALGVLLTPWQPSKQVLTSIFITVIAALWLRMNISKKGVPLSALIFNGALYGLYLCLVV